MLDYTGKKFSKPLRHVSSDSCEFPIKDWYRANAGNNFFLVNLLLPRWPLQSNLPKAVLADTVNRFALLWETFYAKVLVTPSYYQESYLAVVSCYQAVIRRGELSSETHFAKQTCELAKLKPCDQQYMHFCTLLPKFRSDFGASF